MTKSEGGGKEEEEGDDRGWQDVVTVVMNLFLKNDFIKAQNEHGLFRQTAGSAKTSLAAQNCNDLLYCRLTTVVIPFMMLQESNQFHCDVSNMTNCTFGRLINGRHVTAAVQFNRLRAFLSITPLL